MERHIFDPDPLEVLPEIELDRQTVAQEPVLSSIKAREEHIVAVENYQIREAVREIAGHRVKANRRNQHQPRKLISQIIYRFAGLEYY